MFLEIHEHMEKGGRGGERKIHHINEKRKVKLLSYERQHTLQAS